jgi:hypothetical protein
LTPVTSSPRKIRTRRRRRCLNSLPRDSGVVNASDDAAVRRCVVQCRERRVPPALSCHIRARSALPLKADMCGAVAHVCFGSKADICTATRHVCFTANSRLVQRTRSCLLWANSGHRLSPSRAKKINCGKQTYLVSLRDGHVSSAAYTVPNTTL